jgi:glycerophosphoryl diester phosphodiesterase
MKIISHRGLWKETSEQNSLLSFSASQKNGWGIETDLRSFQGKAFLSHDPIFSSDGLVSLEELISLWSETPQLPLFFNIKEDGLAGLLARYRSQIQKLNIIFFDMSVPQLLQFSKEFPKEMLATRFSEFEREPAAAELCSWLWVDSFTKDPTPEEVSSFVLEKKMSLAVVSPEIHSRDPKATWNRFLSSPLLPHEQLAICTDLPLELKRISQ